MQKNYLQKIICFLSFCVLLAGCATNYNRDPHVQQFIQQMVTEHNYNQQQLTTLFSTFKPNPKIIQAMNTPHEALPWYRYRTIFLTTKREQDGAQFWQQHAQTLAFAQQKYGVPAQIIVAILGVETSYGAGEGKYNAFNTLSTLAFDYPPREKYFQSELEQFFLLTQDESLNPNSVLGSYAGALGQPQFMPSSYRHYAVSYRGNAAPDLFHNSDDAIVSIANYLKQYGWQAGGLVATPAHVRGQAYNIVLSRGNHAKWTVAHLANYGITPKVHLAGQQEAMLYALQQPTAPEYWLGLHNFHVIMGYNSSPLYAMAVYQLSEAIKHDYLTRQRN